MLSFILSPLGRLAVAGVAGAVFGFGAAWLIQGWRLDAAKAAFSVFRVQVEALGREAELRAKTAEIANRQAKEKADADYKKVKSDLATSYAAYRKLRDNANSGGGGMPEAPRVTSDTNRTCFDTTQLTRAMGVLETGIPNITEQGDVARNRLIEAMNWAKDLQK